MTVLWVWSLVGIVEIVEKVWTLAGIVEDGSSLVGTARLVRSTETVE